MAHVTFIHGISNKPAAGALHALWLRELAADPNGLNLGAEGVTSSMVYWADVLYAKPDDDLAGYETREADQPAAVDADVAAFAPTAADPVEASFLAGLAAKTGGLLAARDTDEVLAHDRSAAEAALERIPLPWSLKKRFLETYLRDVHHYLFDVEFSPRPGVSYRVRQEIRRRFLEALTRAPRSEPHVVVSHSMGTVIAYDCLKALDACPAVDWLVTIGSPLGIDEVQDRLAPAWRRPDGYPAKVRRGWVNVFDRLDPVDGFDPFIANDYQRGGAPVVEDVEVVNDGVWRHSIGKYLRQPRLRNRMGSMLGITPEG